MITATPANFVVPAHADDGKVVYTPEAARIETALVTAPARGQRSQKAQSVEITIWAESGRYTLTIAAPAALSMAGDLSTILAGLFPDHVTRESAPAETDEAAQ